MVSFRPVAVLIAAVAQAAVPALGYAGLLGKTVGSEAQSIKTPVVPADYAFSIWGFIFLVSLIYAVDQLRPSRRSDPLYESVGWLTAIAFAANAAWSVVAQLQLPLIWTGIIFLTTLFAALPAAERVFAGAGPQGAGRWRVGLPVGTLAAWVTVAIFANWSVILERYGYGEMLGGRTLQGLMFLSGAGLLAAVMVLRLKVALPYVLGIAWALVGLIVGNLERGALVPAAASAAWLLAVVALAWRSCPPPSSQVAGT